MSAAATAAPSRADLELREAVSLAESVVQPDGSVILNIIRPGLGGGRGRHLYEADMLARNADVFMGWKMYVDHLSDQARRALGGLPRSVRDLGGRVVESWWEPNVPADESKGWGQGAVQGRVLPVPYVKELIEHDPELIECSINGDATGVRPTVYKGERALLVEGIKRKGTLDWVTEAGAGGKVASLLEAMDQEALIDASMTDDEVREYLTEHRPGLLEALGKPAGGGDNDGRPTGGDGGGDEVAITPEALREALSTDEGRQELSGLVRELFEADDSLVSEIVEARIADERDQLRAEAEAHTARQIELRDMRDHARSLIEGARLPEKLAEQSLARFAINDDGPADALDVLPDLDDDGNVTKSAMDVLTEAVSAEIASQREIAAAFRPTRVRGQGPSSGDGDGDGKGGDGEKPVTGLRKTSSLLQEAGFSASDLDTVWEGEKATA